MANDKELYQYLVEQDDQQMYTECRQPENEGCVSSSSTPNVAVCEESEPMESFSISDSNEFSTALKKLKALACQKPFR